MSCILVGVRAPRPRLLALTAGIRDVAPELLVVALPVGPAGALRAGPADRAVCMPASIRRLPPAARLALLGRTGAPRVVAVVAAPVALGGVVRIVAARTLAALAAAFVLATFPPALRTLATFALAFVLAVGGRWITAPVRRRAQDLSRGGTAGVLGFRHVPTGHRFSTKIVATQRPGRPPRTARAVSRLPRGRVQLGRHW